MVSQHLFRSEDDHGIYLRGEEVLARGSRGGNRGSGEVMGAEGCAQADGGAVESEGDIIMRNGRAAEKLDGPPTNTADSGLSDPRV